ncbi:MAG: hypothetical protein BECKG1743E_GA0114224_106992 [Candidatus Kentron sp. G]|nr:MAG: hypothetical protein BECKG1743E_GA0114224_106992 [Candidatus Kentron sp. G]
MIGRKNGHDFSLFRYGPHKPDRLLGRDIRFIPIFDASGTGKFSPMEPVCCHALSLGKSKNYA